MYNQRIVEVPLWALAVIMLVGTFVCVTILFSTEDGKGMSNDAQTFADFIEGKEVSLNNMLWLQNGTPNPLNIKWYCQILGIKDDEYVWHKMKDLQEYQVRFTGEQMSLEELRSRK